VLEDSISYICPTSTLGYQVSSIEVFLYFCHDLAYYIQSYVKNLSLHLIMCFWHIWLHVSSALTFVLNTCCISGICQLSFSMGILLIWLHQVKCWFHENFFLAKTVRTPDQELLLQLFIRLDQGERCPPDFPPKKTVPWLEPGLAQPTAALACCADQLHRQSEDLVARVTTSIMRTRASWFWMMMFLMFQLGRILFTG